MHGWCGSVVCVIVQEGSQCKGGVRRVINAVFGGRMGSGDTEMSSLRGRVVGGMAWHGMGRVFGTDTRRCRAAGVVPGSERVVWGSDLVGLGVYQMLSYVCRLSCLGTRVFAVRRAQTLPVFLVDTSDAIFREYA